VVVAPVANALWAGGWIALAVLLLRRRLVHRAVAIGLPLTWVATIPPATLGGCLLSGAYWMALGVALATGALWRGRPDDARRAVSVPA
jgi:hypothetical protein